MPILECHALEKRYGSAMALDHIQTAEARAHWAP